MFTKLPSATKNVLNQTDKIIIVIIIIIIIIIIMCSQRESNR